MPTMDRKTTTTIRAKIEGRDEQAVANALAIGVEIGRQIEKSSDPDKASWAIEYDPNYLADFAVATIVDESVDVFSSSRTTKAPIPLKPEAPEPRKIRDVPQA